MDVDTLWDRLRRRKVVQWGVAYAAGAWGLLQGLGYVTQTFGWPAVLQQLATLALLIGLPMVLVIAWYHGDRGQQKVTPAELMIIALLFLVGGAMFWRYDHAGPAGSPAAANAGASPSAAGSSSGAAAPRNSIAVLPFVNMSQDTANEYFSDGVSEEILNSLAQIPALQVAARTSSFSFKGQKKEIPDIARDLRVRMVLEGSVRKQGDRVRITAQLIDAENGFHVWSQTYDRELQDIFAIQDEIAHAIASALQVKLASSHAAAGDRPDSVDVQAYDLYLRGLALWQARGQDNLNEAERHFRQAVQRDPKFAKAWAGIALVQTLRPDYFGTPTSIAYPRAQDAAERALALDSALPEAYAALGNTAFNDGRVGTARELFDRAVALAPSYATAWQWYGYGLTLNGYADEGLPYSRRAVELDPKAPIVRQDLAVTLLYLQRFDEVEAECAKVLAIHVDQNPCRSYIFDGRLQRKDYTGARAVLLEWSALRSPEAVAFAKELMDALEGKVDPAPVAARLLPMPDGILDLSAPTTLGDAEAMLWFVAVGRPEDAVARLTRTAAALPNLARLNVALPGLDTLRCRPDFQAIVARLNIVDRRAASVCGVHGSAPR